MKQSDTFPFDSAVNMAEVNMLKPQNRKLNAKIEKPFAVIRYTSEFLCAKSAVISEPPSQDTRNISSEIAKMKLMLIQKMVRCLV